MKIGRNDPCPCGSGKKYKKCCIDKDRKEEHRTKVSGSGEPEAAPAEKGEAHASGAEAARGEDSADGEAEAAGGVKSPLVEKLEELVDKGPLRAHGAVSVDTKLPLEMLENTPVVRFLEVFLESLVRNGGRAPIKSNGRVDLDENLLRETAEMWPGVDTSISSPSGKTLFPLHVSYVELIASGLDCIEEEGEEVVLSEKGKAVIRNTKVRNTYTRSLRMMTYTYNWFAFSQLPEVVEDIQELCGLELLLLDYPYQKGIPVDPANLIKQMDSIIPLSERFASYDLDERRFSEIVHDYFLAGFCYLFGFVVPSRGKGRKRDLNWYVSELYHEMFRWKL